MATISITVPDAVLPRIIDAFLAEYSYNPVLSDGSPNPETPAAFVRRTVREYVKTILVMHEARVAANLARDEATAKASTDVG